MSLTFLTGGARSGKSIMAVDLAARSGAPVTVIATAEESDDEMAERIARHRAERPDAWTVIEEPRDLRGALVRCEPGVCVVIDCLTLWVNNLLLSADEPSDEEMVGAAEDAARVAAARSGPTIVVTNELGSGIVPMHPLGRRFRDLLGSVNQTWARRAERSYLVVAGKALELRDIYAS